MQNCNCTILIVDDNKNNLFTLNTLICEHISQVNVLEADSGEAALSVLMKNSVDLIILDIQMPGMDGFETATFIRSAKKTANIPIVFLTAAYKSEDFKEKGFAVGAADYLTKPIDTPQLINKIKIYLRFIEQERKHHRELEEKVKERTADLAYANKEIIKLNEQLKAENLRMGAELDVSRRIQHMVLPDEDELQQIPQLDIAAFMESADEVGGDYYDVLRYNDKVIIAIGDVTGHGLESGVLMLMVQTAVRSLLDSGVEEPLNFLTMLNRILYHNIRRLNTDKTLTFCLLEYKPGILIASGQHEYILVARANGDIERIDTLELGFMLGLEDDISGFSAQQEIPLNSGDCVVLYTDGITEAMNHDDELYEIDRLCAVIEKNRTQAVQQLCDAIIEDVRRHMGDRRALDDITLMILKQK